MSSTLKQVEPFDKLSDHLTADEHQAIAAETPTGVAPNKLASTAGYYAAFVSLGLVASSLGPTLLGLAENTQTLVREISFLFTARALGYMLGSLLGGRLYDRLSGHKVMTLALIAMAVMMTLTPMMSILWSLTLVLLLLGVGEGMLDVGGNTLLVWLYRHKVGPYMNALHFFFGVGAFFGPIIIAQVTSSSGGITWAYWVLALLVLPSALWLFRLPSPPSQRADADTPARRLNYLLLALLAGFFFLFVGAEVGFGGWIFTFAVSLDLADTTSAAYLTSAFWGALTVGRLLAIPLTARFRPRIILFSDLFGCLLSVGLILVWPESLIAIWLGTFGMGVSMASMFPVTLSLAERRIAITGKVTGIFLVGASLGSMSIPWLIGQFFDLVGPWVMMVILAVDLIGAMGVLIALILYSSRPEPGPVVSNPAASELSQNRF
jgi:FHS family Na+ dependent glucose MFS transporter 1